MTEGERSARRSLWVRLLQVFGQEASDERIAMLAEETEDIPWLIPPVRGMPEPEPELLFPAAMHAAILRVRGWPPGPGDVLDAAIEIGGRLPNEGRGASERRWVYDARSGRVGPRCLGAEKSALIAASKAWEQIEAGPRKKIDK